MKRYGVHCVKVVIAIAIASKMHPVGAKKKLAELPNGSHDPFGSETYRGYASQRSRRCRASLNLKVAHTASLHRRCTIFDVKKKM